MALQSKICKLDIAKTHHICLFGLTEAEIQHRKKQLLDKHIEQALRGWTLLSDREQLHNLCCSRLFFVEYQNHLVLCGLYHINEKRDKIGDWHQVHACCDYLLYSQQEGFYLLCGCSEPLGCPDPSLCISPMVVLCDEEENKPVLLKYGDTYKASKFNKVLTVSNVRTSNHDGTCFYNIDVLENGRIIKQLNRASLFHELPDTQTNFIYSTTDNPMKRYVPASLYNILTQREDRLLCNGGYLFSHHRNTSLPYVMTQYDNSAMHISDEENYYFYISHNDTVAFKELMSCVEKCGHISRIKNLFDEDASLNYKICFPKKTAISEFVMTLIFSSGEFYPKIFGIPIHDVLEVICRRYEHNPYALPEHKIDEESAVAIVDYIRCKLQDITDAEIVKVLVETYGQYAVAERHEKYWMYYHGEMLRDERLPGAYYKTLHKTTLDKKWKSEWLLYRLIYAYFPDTCIHYMPAWLNGQHLDIYIPSLSMGVEYQGEQHYVLNNFFGGEMGFENRRHLDKMKQEKCRENNILLLEWPYTKQITPINLINILYSHGIKNIPTPNPLNIPPENTAEATSKIQTLICMYSIEGVLVDKFSSYDKAERVTGISKQALYKATHGYSRSAGQYQWRSFPEEQIPSHIEPLPKQPTAVAQRSVYQVSKSGEVIAEYTSLAEASRVTGVNTKSIRCVLQGTQKSAGGFFWVEKNSTTNSR